MRQDFIKDPNFHQSQALHAETLPISMGAFISAILAFMMGGTDAGDSAGIFFLTLWEDQIRAEILGWG